MREQKEEAERFNEKRAQLAAVLRENFLFQLFHINKEMEGHQEAIESLEDESKEVQGREATAEESLKAAKKAHAKLSQQLSAAEKNVKQHLAEMLKFEPRQIKQAAEAKSLQKKMAEDEKAASKVRRDQEELAERIEGIEEDISQLGEAEAALEKSASDARSKSGVELDDERREEYESLKAEASRRTAADRSQLESLQRQQSSEENTMTQLDQDHAELRAKLENDSGRLGKLNERWESINAAAEGARAQTQEVEVELQALQAKAVGENAERKKTEKELEEVQSQLREVKDDRQQSKQEEKMADCLEALKRLYPGVKGRLVDLCRPVQKSTKPR